MGCIHWWQSNEEETDFQLSLAIDSQKAFRHGRVDSVGINESLTNAIKKNIPKRLTC